MTTTGELFRNRKIPMILAHRGSQVINNYPENTIPAFQEAMELGADGFELDVRLTRDNQLAIFHDKNLWRMAGKYIELKTLHSNNLPDIPLTANKSENKICIPLLSDLFRTFGDSVIYNLEIKKTVRNSKIIIKALWKLIEAYQLQEKVWLSSFDPIFLWHWNRQGYRIHTGYLFETWNFVTKYFCNKSLITILHPNIILLTHTGELNIFGKPLCFWSVNNREELKFAKNSGCQAIITDDVRLAKEVLG